MRWHFIVTNSEFLLNKLELAGIEPKTSGSWCDHAIVCAAITRTNNCLLRLLTLGTEK